MQILFRADDPHGGIDRLHRIDPARIIAFDLEQFEDCILADLPRLIDIEGACDEAADFGAAVFGPLI
ncbi:hypothetical protein D3C87_1861190 [compost metagenome]